MSDRRQARRAAGQGPGARGAVLLAIAVLLAAALGEARAEQQQPAGDPPPPSPAAPGAQGPAAAAAAPDASGAEGETAEEEPRSSLRITADAACEISVDGEPLGTLQPGEVLEHSVAPGPRRIRATSVEYRTAILDKTVEAAAGAGSDVELRMARTIRVSLRDERQEWTYKDLKRELMWPRRDNGRDIAWRHARRHCEELTHGGFTEWRLPTIEELDQLKAIWSMAPFKIAGGIFLSGCCPWSSTRDGEGRAWNYNFRHKRRFSVPTAYSLDLRALCVHTLEEWAPPADAEGADTEDSEAAGDPAAGGESGG